MFSTDFLLCYIISIAFHLMHAGIEMDAFDMKWRTSLNHDQNRQKQADKKTSKVAFAWD